MDSRAREIIKIGDKMFADKRQVDSLWQEIALNFFPERADFTTKRTEGEEFADHLFSSYPVLARRELGNLLGEYLRPDKWLAIHVDDEDLDQSDQERAYLEHLTEIQWRAMNDPAANLVTAANQADHDFATFGNAVEWYGRNVNRDAYLFRNYHLRDNAWGENAEGKIDFNNRNWEPTARQLVHQFKDKVSAEVKKAFEKDPQKTFPCRHVVVPTRVYDYKSKGGKRFPFASLYVECESETVLEEVGQNHFDYVISRWQHISNSVFGVAMTTAVLLPDGRTLQVVMRTLREAGEMHVNPPMLAVMEAIRSDIALYPGGITTTDMAYDERLGDVLRPITRDKGGFPIGEQIAEALKQDIRSGFLLDKIQLPETTAKMTATEVRRRIQEYTRASAPISKPIQKERNYPLCDGMFNLLMQDGVFPIDEMPASLERKEIKFKFRSPLDDLIEQNEAALYIENRDTILIPAAKIDPSILEEVDLHEATRDALRSNGWKQKWFKPKEAAEAMQEEMGAKVQSQQMMQELLAAGQIAEQGGKGIDALMTAGQPKGGAKAAPPQRNGAVPA